ncbi:cell division protein ZipA [Thermomonas sp.]|jgi:cell division protein ZipA|uniref:cell division protein ZipA n=1 Tax=Thermomonas sp. TaxID=1971895 RepID=UPI001B3E1408|nr:cell division protein ZipA [Thermomonas sp.]HQY36599.1 cell division protein ZipA [Pseudomonadota bacterium]MBK6332855.1 cell division protein ZipA [Thermomonas sp.]MBK6417364.1 cell division protein ZipA [Thermomonas sp.]MBK6924598.1 cell division protein ZipA [Thermomonas sp.]MBK7206265.1 cell division protein ZipA [Thermomonas sp.]
MSDTVLLRIGIAIALSLLFGAIIYFGRGRKAGQGRRIPREPSVDADGRQEPTLGEQLAGSWGHAPAQQDELELDGSPAQSELGRRVSDQFDRIVSLYVAARAGNKLRGQDIVVAAEKAGLTFGHMDVFHRLVDGKPELGPIFSVANIIKPGSFEMSRIAEIETPAIAFFLTLPAPVAALDAWETMEPAAQRMADLLDGVVLDEERNALGRQRIQHIRDELRAYDRQHAAPPLSKPTRW